MLKGKYLHCTVKGLHLIAWLDSHLPRLTDPVETALWEDAFREIEKGAVKPQQFVAGISQTIGQHLNTLRNAIPDEVMKPTAAQCPSGKGPLLEGEFRYESPGYPNVRLPKVVCNLAISAEEYAKILAGEKIVREGFYSKEKKRHFSAGLVFNQEKQKIDFDFAAADRIPPQTLEIRCPKTDQPVLAAEKWFTFPGWPDVRRSCQNGIPRFELLQRFQQKPQGTLLYYVFDLPYLDGKDLTDLPLLRRRELLKKVLAENEVIRFSGAVEGEGKRFFELASQRGLEGIVAKRKDSTYQPGRRSKSWLKIKSRMQQEAVIGGITEPSGSRKHFGALMLGVYDQGKLRYVGHTGTGFSDEMLKDILKRLTPYFTDSCPFDPRPKDSARVQWVKPRLVCEVAFQEWTSDGKLRAPAFLGLREDKSPMEVVREHLAGPPKKVFPAQPK